MSNEQPDLPKISDFDENENPTLTEEVTTNTEMKSWLVEYVGTKLNPEDDTVTVEMIVEVMSEEFPEFLMALAEENWIRGYRQALADVEAGQKAHQNEKNFDIIRKN